MNIRLAVSRTVGLLLPRLAACTKSQPGESADQKALLTTGASTRLGRAMAKHMAENGYFVYSGARKNTMTLMRQMQSRATRRSVLMLLTRREIDAAVEIVRGLYALINNAGAGIDDVK